MGTATERLAVPDRVDRPERHRFPDAQLFFQRQQFSQACRRDGIKRGALLANTATTPPSAFARTVCDRVPGRQYQRRPGSKLWKTTVSQIWNDEREGR